MYTAIFDTEEILMSVSAKQLWYSAYRLLRWNARYITPGNFTHMDIPELGITAARFTITETFTDDGKLHTSTCIERN